MRQDLRKQKDIIMFLDEKNFYFKMSVPQRKKKLMQFLALTHSLYEGWKWRRIKKSKTLYGRKKMSSTANKHRIKKSEVFFPYQVAKFTIILSCFIKQLFTTTVASGLLFLREEDSAYSKGDCIPTPPALRCMDGVIRLVSVGAGLVHVAFSPLPLPGPRHFLPCPLLGTPRLLAE